MKRILKISLWVLAGLFVLLQCFPCGRSNPPVTGDLVAPPEVKAVLVRCCYDCHSNESRWPWYAYVNPVAWLVTHDVNDGRKHLNFSEWASYSQDKRSSKADEAVEQVRKGEMPMANYLWMHGDARLTAADIKLLEAWNDSL